jgi:hypothetical protein
MGRTPQFATSPSVFRRFPVTVAAIITGLVERDRVA